MNKTITEHIRDYILGNNKTIIIFNLIELRESEWSNEFEILMRNRLIFGAIRYGKMGDSNKPQYDRMEYCKRKINEYENTGNLECLIDGANMFMLEFVEGEHQNRHFKSKDNHNEHCKEVL